MGCFVLCYVCGGAPVLVLRDWPGIWRAVTVETGKTHVATSQKHARSRERIGLKMGKHAIYSATGISLQSRVLPNLACYEAIRCGSDAIKITVD